MANYRTTDTDLTTVADAIRSKGGTSASLVFPSGFATAIGNIKALPSTITAGDTPVAWSGTVGRTSSTTLADTGISLTVPKAGTWRVYWIAVRTNTSSSYTWGTQLYKGSTAQGTEVTTWTTNYQINYLDLTLAKNDVLKVYARGRGSSYYVCTSIILCCNATLF